MEGDAAARLHVEGNPFLIQVTDRLGVWQARRMNRLSKQRAHGGERRAGWGDEYDPLRLVRRAEAFSDVREGAILAFIQQLLPG